jgi:hypothetical protein
MKRFLLLLPLAAIAWFGYGVYLGQTIETVEIQTITALPVSGEKTLPFYELMSPLPELAKNQLLPKLEYKKGPPQRFIEKISVYVQPPKGQGKERITYFGRRTREDFPLLSLLPEGENREARYLEWAIQMSQGQEVPLSWWKAYLLRPLLLREASHWLQSVDRVYVMEQSGNPAFLFEGKLAANGRKRSTALFIRRNSFYRVEYLGNAEFHSMRPLDLFRKSFLTDRRADAMEYLAKNLSEVRLDSSGLRDDRAIAWPILLLAANVSVDPSSIEAYFHFAGISALLYRSQTMDRFDTEALDILRNNVLASEFYAKDVNPKASKTLEIGRLARLLTRNFE